MTSSLPTACYFGVGKHDARKQEQQWTAKNQRRNTTDLKHTILHGHAGDQAKQVSVAVGISYTEYYLNCAHMGMSAYTATSGTLRCGPLTAQWQAQTPAWQICIWGPGQIQDQI